MILRNKYFMIALVAVLISTVYWSVFGAHALSTYHEYADLGLYTLDMYYHVTYPAAVHGLQYLIFGTHVAPDQILLLPFFAMAESPLTLLVMQAVIVSFTGLALFFIARDLLKSDKIALILCLAFLLNPGVHGIMVFDYHAELLIPLFFLTTFYFLVKRRKYAFIVSLLLLLGTIEVAPFICIGFGVTMALYAIFREKDKAVRNSWLKYSATAIVVSIIAFGFCSFVAGSLTHSYAMGKYPDLPQISKLQSFSSQQLSSVGAAFAAGGAISQYSSIFFGYLVFALVIVFLGFGVSSLFDPLFAILFVAPWLFEVFIVGNSEFIFTWNQYFSYTVAGAAAVAILALRNFNDSEETKNFLSFFRHKNKVKKYVIASIPICAVLLLLASPMFLFSKNVNNLQQDLLFQTSQGERQQIQQLNSMVALVPKNASVMGTFFTLPQLSLRKYVELIASEPNQDKVVPRNATGATDVYGMWFQPDYILVDFSQYISLNAATGYQIQNFINITGATVTSTNVSFNGPYRIYAYNGTALLLKRAS
jgi:uncharacterized membrane protein